MNHRLNDHLFRDLFVFEDERNPRTSRIDIIWPPTVLDQVFDQLSPTRKSLREILDSLKQDIITGGIGNIVFPVTSVQARGGDIMLTADDLGLGRVDNTRDVDKPLSTPQRSAIMDILSTYKFDVDLADLRAHVLSKENPHDVSVSQINNNGDLTDLIDRRIEVHSLSKHSTVHSDIRMNTSILWTKVDELAKEIQGKLELFTDKVTPHIDDPDAHMNVINLREAISNKAVQFDTAQNNNHTLYPTTRAVVDFVDTQIKSMVLPSVPTSWIGDIKLTDTKLPLPGEKHYRDSYIIKHGPDGFGTYNALAICRKNSSGDYFWDISNLNTVTRYNPFFFKDTPDGLSLNVENIIASSVDIDKIFDSIKVHDNYIYGSMMDVFVREIKIVPGSMDGFLQYYINNNPSTMSDNIPIPGLQSMAFKDFITENEVKENAIHNRHLLSRSVDSRVIKEGSVTKSHLDFHVPDFLTHCSKMTLLGNIMNDNGNMHEVDMIQLSDILRPLIGGWPDPNVPGSERNIHQFNPQQWDPGIEQTFYDGRRGMRFTGKINVLANQSVSTVLSTHPSISGINSKKYRLLETGGSWCTDSDRRAWSSLGGTNVTGHTFADVEMNENEILLTSISTGNRMGAPYDIWIVYLHMDDDPWITGEWYDNHPHYNLTPQPRPNGQINFHTEKIYGLQSNEVHLINGVEYTPDLSEVPIEESYFFKIIEIIHKGDQEVTRDSPIQYLEIPMRPYRPGGFTVKYSEGTGNNGEIVGVGPHMEFKIGQEDRPWIDSAVFNPIGLERGVYWIRCKSTSTSFASEISTVTIN